MLTKILALIALSQSLTFATQSALNHPAGRFSDCITTQDNWETLGPFQLGTREAAWGADPLEVFGGFHSLRFDKKTSFPSSLATNATVFWRLTTADIDTDHDDELRIRWTLNHDDIGWDFMQSVYGWSTLQYFTWVRGILYNNQPEPQLVSLYLTHVLEVRVNDQHYFGGDFYGLHKVPLILELPAGNSIIELRLIRDVRAQGGVGKPSLHAEIRLHNVEAHVRILEQSIISPEIYGVKVSSPYFGLTVQNGLPSDILINVCGPKEVSSDLELIGDKNIKLTAGQARPIALRLKETVNVTFTAGETVKLRLCYMRSSGRDRSVHTLALDIPLTATDIQGFHRFTFLHSSGVVSYALIRPPDATDVDGNQTPILLELHGAGVEADSDLVRHSLDGVNMGAFTIFPTGTTAWSGDDWHTWAMSDVFAAVAALVQWQVDVKWHGPPINVDRFLVSGHSNGGQGTWYLSTHHPDKVIAATPLSGYTSIENYVPYSFWHVAEQNRILDTARLDFRNELFISNLHGMPVLQQHGSTDDNVPPYHSRLMRTYRADLRFDSNYIEVPGAGHWWQGVLTTPQLQEFYKRQFAGNTTLRQIPDQFEYIVADSNNFGSMYGLKVDQLRSHDRLGHLQVTRNRHDKTVWHIQTANIHRFHILAHELPSEALRCAHIDEGEVCLTMANTSLSRSNDGKWTEGPLQWTNLETRHGRQRGVLDAIMNTLGPLQIVDYTGRSMSLALQIVQNMVQYFGADSVIMDRHEYHSIVSGKGNIIVLSQGLELPSSLLPRFPIVIEGHTIKIIAKDGTETVVEQCAGMGAIFLRPLPDERLELVVWGTDSDGLSQAFRLIPTMTGAGQPDFVILGSTARWKGVGGALAMGFLDHNWEISGGSYV